MTRDGTLKRSGMKRSPMRPVYTRPPSPPPVRVERCGSFGPAANALVETPKEVKAKPGKRTPTAIEKIWLDAITAHRCIACRLDGVAPLPACVHHILRGGRRIGHLYSLPLCPGHHQDGHGAPGLIARHPWKQRFEQRYGTELELLGTLKRELGFFNKAEYA